MKISLKKESFYLLYQTGKKSGKFSTLSTEFGYGFSLGDELDNQPVGIIVGDGIAGRYIMNQVVGELEILGFIEALRPEKEYSNSHNRYRLAENGIELASLLKLAD